MASPPFLRSVAEGEVPGMTPRSCLPPLVVPRIQRSVVLAWVTVGTVYEVVNAGWDPKLSETEKPGDACDEAMVEINPANSAIDLNVGINMLFEFFISSSSYLRF
jgi:hypothetical protein